MSDRYRFGGGAAETALSPVVLVAMIVGILLIFLLPRKFLIVPLLLIIFLVPLNQTLVLGGVHLFVARIVILFGVARLFTATFTSKGGVLAGGFNTIDKVFLCWALSQALAFMLLYGQTDAVVNQFGFLWDSLGGYFLLRFAIHNEEDIRRTTKVFALFAIVVAFCMLNEQRSMTNVFGLIGGRTIPDIREGRLRSQGPFAHSILAGVFGATILPLFLRLWSTKKDRLVTVAGILGATAMVITSGSSTPLGAYVAGILGLCLWPIRRNMRALRWGLVLAIVALALVMKAPVWFLLARVDFVGGSSSYHRALLVDQCIQRFGDWWLLGASNNQSWGWDMWDVQNYFVAQALRGGLAAFVLFIMIVSRAFGRLGKARKRVEANRQQEWLMWTLGSVIFANVVAFFGADYFDQTRFWWYASLAMVSAATSPLLTNKKKPAGTELVHFPIDDPRIVQLSPFQIVRK
jgi:hypothetical protein